MAFPVDARVRSAQFHSTHLPLCIESPRHGGRAIRECADAGGLIGVGYLVESAGTHTPSTRSGQCRAALQPQFQLPVTRVASRRRNANVPVRIDRPTVIVPPAVSSSGPPSWMFAYETFAAVSSSLTPPVGSRSSITNEESDPLGGTGGRVCTQPDPNEAAPWIANASSATDKERRPIDVDTGSCRPAPPCVKRGSGRAGRLPRLGASTLAPGAHRSSNR